jgi:hypothetical protein
MKNKTLWAVVGVVVVVIIIVVAVMMHGSGGSSTSTGGTATNGANAGTGSSAMSLNDLLASGQSQQCGFSTQSATSTTVTGTVYVGSGHLRGDFSVKNSSGTLTASHIITDGQTAYVWTDSPAQGMEISFASMSSGNAEQSQGSVNPSQKMNYSCAAWATDATKFTLPANVTFMNMTNMPGMNMNTTGSVGTGPTGASNAAACAMCAQAGTATAQGQCRAAMHC